MTISWADLPLYSGIINGCWMVAVPSNARRVRPCFQIVRLRDMPVAPKRSLVEELAQTDHQARFPDGIREAQATPAPYKPDSSRESAASRHGRHSDRWSVLQANAYWSGSTPSSIRTVLPTLPERGVDRICRQMNAFRLKLARNHDASSFGSCLDLAPPRSAIRARCPAHPAPPLRMPSRVDMQSRESRCSSPGSGDRLTSR